MTEKHLYQRQGILKMYGNNYLRIIMFIPWTVMDMEKACMMQNSIT